MDEEILQPKASNPLATAMLMISCLFLIVSISMSRIEVVEYLEGFSPSDFEVPVKRRIQSKYKNDSQINKLRKKMEKEMEPKNAYGFIFDESGSSAN